MTDDELAKRKDCLQSRTRAQGFGGSIRLRKAGLLEMWHPQVFFQQSL